MKKSLVKIKDFAMSDARVRGNALAQNRCNSLPCTVRISRQRSCNQKVGCLLNFTLLINLGDTQSMFKGA